MVVAMDITIVIPNIAGNTEELKFSVGSNDLIEHLIQELCIEQGIQAYEYALLLKDHEIKIDLSFGDAGIQNSDKLILKKKNENISLQTHSQLVINGVQYPLTLHRCIIGRANATIERQPDIDLGSLEGGQTVSREHLLVEWDGHQHYLHCLKDFPNKIFVNNQEINPDNRFPLMHGDIIVFGDILARFECLLLPLSLPTTERPYARLRSLDDGTIYYIQKNPGFIGRARKKYFPEEHLAFDLGIETEDVLSLSRPHAKIWMGNDGRVFIMNVKPSATIWINGQAMNGITELDTDISLKLARLEFQLHLLA
jgi:pSer/pThr/pTyr-binding forkhead associated (FHA) protein